MPLVIPARLSASCELTPEGRGWLARLPSIVDDLESRWSLTIGDPFDGDDVSCAWVAPATQPDGSAAVLKVAMPHFEAAHEIAGLRFWNGDPTVRLIDADEKAEAMLLEQCVPGTHLRLRPLHEQDAIVAALLRRLWRSPGTQHAFRPLSTLLAYWAEETLASESEWADPGLVREGLSLFRDLPSTATRTVLLATDLHAGNVLQAEREPWLVIDPKPFVGDPAYDATQHLLNRIDTLWADPLGTIERFAELLRLDAERVRLWTFARLAADPRHDWRDPRPFEVARALDR